LDESSFTNKNLEAGKMLFFVFFDSDCDHCQHAISYINQHITEFKKTPIYLITLDSREKINQFMAKYGANLKDKKNITLLQDRKYEFLPKFKPRKYPAMYLYSTQKKLIHYDDEPGKYIDVCTGNKQSSKITKLNEKSRRLTIVDIAVCIYLHQLRILPLPAIIFVGWIGK
jgi:arsenate reductase-like glutaredoxin family protein